MCLSCANTSGHLKDLGIAGKEALTEVLSHNPPKTILHTHDNKRLVLTKEQRDEIANHAILIVATSVDLSCDIWAIQWPNDYKVKTFNDAALGSNT